MAPSFTQYRLSVQKGEESYSVRQRLLLVLPISAISLVLFRTLFLPLALAGSAFAASFAQAEAPEFPGLKALMSEEEFTRTGLDRLTPAQRAALNRWLSQRARFKLEESLQEDKAAPAKIGGAKTSKRRAAEAAEGPEKSAQKPKRVVAKRLSRSERTAEKPIRTRIVGKFTGWSGTTLFALENGQYWKQRQTGRYYYKADSPEVELFKNRFGFWELRILATGKTVKVSRYEP